MLFTVVLRMAPPNTVYDYVGITELESTKKIGGNKALICKRYLSKNKLKKL